MSIIEKIKKLDVAWYGAAAGAAAAGATLVPNHRIIAGGLAAAFVLAIGAWRMPCCDGCAAGAGCGGDTPAENRPTPESDAGGGPLDFQQLYEGSGAAALVQRVRCMTGGCA